MSPLPRVVVTGLGTVNPLAHSVADFWAGLLAGKSGIAKLAKIPHEDLPVHIGGEVKDFDIGKWSIAGLEPPYHLDNAVLYALAAASEAIKNSGLDIPALAAEVGAIVATGIGGIGTTEAQMFVKFEKGPRRVSPRVVPMLMPNAVAGNISIYFGIKGPSYSVASACASSVHAIINAAQAIRLGELKAVVTGGSEATLTPFCVAGFGNMKALSKSFEAEPHRASRPFDAKRDGFVMGEGAGILVLEDYEFAKARGARILAEILSYGASSDAGDIVAPDPVGAGALAASQKAFRMAGLNPAEVAAKVYVNAHGTSTPLGDKAETLALKKVFGDAASQIRVSSSKSMTGHLIGAAGAIESIACIRTLLEGQAPPTINLENPDPDCDLNYVPNKPVKAVFEYAVNNSFGFGGHNGVLIFKKI